jgi:hypothetical protein
MRTKHSLRMRLAWFADGLIVSAMFVAAVVVLLVAATKQ